MPAYDFKHPDREEYIEVSFGMNEDKEYVDEDGLSWERVFSLPLVAPPSRSLDLNKPMYDKKGKPLRVVPLSDEFIRKSGFSNAADYIEWNNSMVDQTKTPERNLDLAHSQAADKGLQEMITENQEKLKENNKQAKIKQDRLNSTKKRDISAVAHTNSDWEDRDSSYESIDHKIEAYDNHARTKKHTGISVNDKLVAGKKPNKKKSSK